MSINFFREARLATGQTQAEVAERAGMERTAIVRIEAGGRSLRVDRVNELAAALDVTPEAVLLAMGVNLAPRRQDLVDHDMVTDLLEAPAEVRSAVQLLLDGWRVQRRADKALEAGLRANYPEAWGPDGNQSTGRKRT